MLAALEVMNLIISFRLNPIDIKYPCIPAKFMPAFILLRINSLALSAAALSNSEILDSGFSELFNNIQASPYLAIVSALGE